MGWGRVAAACVAVGLLGALVTACSSGSDGAAPSPAAPPGTDRPAGAGTVPGAVEVPALVAKVPATKPAPADPDNPGIIIDPTVMRADPSVTWDPDTRKYRMYTTQLWNANVPMWVSDKVEGPWEWAGDALPKPPEWASDDFRLWTPEVSNIHGVWTLWATAGVKDSKALCLYRATGPSASGPFVAEPGPAKWCDVSVGGAIDPQTIKDDAGDWWLIYKVNRNVYGNRTGLAAMRLGADGLPTGAAQPLLEATEPWQHDLVEAPGFIRDPGTGKWWLTYSGGKIEPDGSTNYQVSAVPCTGPAGPCFAQFRVSLLKTNKQGAGPGEQSTFVDTEGNTWMSYNPVAPFVAPDSRPLALVRVAFDDKGVPYVARPPT